MKPYELATLAARLYAQGSLTLNDSLTRAKRLFELAQTHCEPEQKLKRRCARTRFESVKLAIIAFSNTFPINHITYTVEELRSQLKHHLTPPYPSNTVLLSILNELALASPQLVNLNHVTGTKYSFTLHRQPQENAS